jgi:hypothetical protein
VLKLKKTEVGQDKKSLEVEMGDNSFTKDITTNTIELNYLDKFRGR